MESRVAGARTPRVRYDWLRHVGVLVLAVTVTACGDVFGSDSEPTIWPSATNLVIPIDSAIRMTAVYQRNPRSSVATGEGARWSVHPSDSSVIGVTSDGVVRARRPGVAQVHVELNGATASARVLVVEQQAWTTKWRAVQVSDETACAVTVEQRVYCWGGDYYGAVGDGVLGRWTSVHAPAAVAGNLQQVTSVAVGMFHACALTTDKSVWCWGDGGVTGADDGGDRSVSSPRRIAGPRFARISTSGNHLCGIDDSGKAYCWGIGSRGQLGDGVIGLASRKEPHEVQTSLRFTSIVAGTDRTCAIATDRRVYCWGLASFGMLGTGSDVDTAVPVRISGDFEAVALTGNIHACIETSDGEFVCWGPNIWKQLGDASEFVYVPEPIGVESAEFSELFAGNVNTCALKAGVLYCWGLNRDGNLGSGDVPTEVCGIDRYSCTAVPMQVSGGLSFRQVSMSTTVSCGVTVDDALYCWGSNHNGLLGNGSAADASNVPVRVSDPF